MINYICMKLFNSIFIKKNDLQLILISILEL